jgi:hypothetical protein
MNADPQAPEESKSDALPGFTSFATAANRKSFEDRYRLYEQRAGL